MSIKNRMEKVLEDIGPALFSPTALCTVSSTPLAPNPGTLSNVELTPKAQADHDLVVQVADVLATQFLKTAPDAQERAVANLLHALQALAGPQQMVLTQRLKEPRKQNTAMEPGMLRTSYGH